MANWHIGMSDIKQRTVRAAGWAFFSKLLSQIVSFAVGVVLARLLIPDDFGLIAMAAFFVGVASLMVDVGFGHALIQKQDTTEVHFDSIFWTNALLSISLGLLLFFSANLIADFYGKHELTRIMELLSVVFVFAIFGFIPRMVLSKRLDFKSISISELAGMIVSGGIAITLASIGFGYWSLVIHILVQNLITMILLIFFAKWAPKFRFDIRAVKELFGFSFYIFMTRLLQYVAGSVDKMLLGKYVGSYSTGIYDKAQSIMLTPLAAISDSIGSVMFPSMSLIQNDKERVRDIYIRSTRAIALITFPMMTGMFVVSESFVYSVLGEKWGDIIPAIKIFCVAGMFSSLATVIPAVFQSLGKSRLQFKVNLITQPIRIISIVIGIKWGMYGVIISFAISSIITRLFSIAVACRLLDLSMRALFLHIIGIIASALLMSSAVMCLTLLLGDANYTVKLFVQVVSGILLYYLLVVIFGNPAYKDVMRVVKDAINVGK